MGHDTANRPVLVLACDEAYAMPLAITLRSLVETNESGWPLEIHVLTDGFSEELKGKVIDSLPNGAVALRWVTVSLDSFRDFYVGRGLSTIAFARLLIPKVFAESVTRVLYLDCDILVLDDLRSLWATDLEGAVVGAVLDGLDSQLKNCKIDRESYPSVQSYFNSGVLLIDLDRWREEQISEKAFRYLSKFPNAPMMDQDALNFACDGRWKELGPRWNFQQHYAKRIEAMVKSERPSIVHFVTGSKPWKASIGSVNARFYDSFRSRTKFRRKLVERSADAVGAWYGRAKRVLRRLSLGRVAQNGAL